MMNIVFPSMIALPEYNFLGSSVNHVLLAFLLLAIINTLRTRGRIFFLEQEKDFLLDVIHRTTSSLTITKNMHEELVLDNIPPLVSTKVRRLVMQIDDAINLNTCALSASLGKMDDKFKTDEYELYTYITSLVNRYREYAENCRVELNLFADAGYRICNIPEIAFTSALQGLVKRSIDSTRPNGSVNISVLCKDDQWSMEISNCSPERYYVKYFGQFLTFVKICCGGSLRFIWHVVRRHGGKISGYELGKSVYYKITAPLSTNDALMADTSDTGQLPHIVLIMADRKLSGYLKAALSDEYRVSVYEHYEQITIPLSNDNTDIFIIDAEPENREVCSKIKNNKQTSDVPILLLIPSNDAEDLKEFEEWRADRILPRMVPVKRLKAELLSIREERKQQLERVVRLVNTDFSAGFPEDLMLSEEDAQIMRKINGFLEEHLGEKIKIDMLAQELTRCTTRLFMLVKRITNVSPTCYILYFKMERAPKMLLNQQLSIGEVATMLGYGTDKYFGIVFRKYYGCSPKEYREKYVKCSRSR